MKNKMFKMSLILLFSIFSIVKSFNENDKGISLYDQEGYYNPEAFEIVNDLNPNFLYTKNNVKKQYYDDANKFAHNMMYFDNIWNGKGINLYDSEGYYNPNAFKYLNSSYIVKNNGFFKNKKEDYEASDFYNNMNIWVNRDTLTSPVWKL